MAAFKVGDAIDGLKISGLRLLSQARLFAGKVSEDDKTLLTRVQEEGTLVSLTPRRLAKASENGKLSRTDLRTGESRLALSSESQVTSK